MKSLLLSELDRSMICLSIYCDLFIDGVVCVYIGRDAYHSSSDFGLLQLKTMEVYSFYPIFIPQLVEDGQKSLTLLVGLSNVLLLVVFFPYNLR